MMRYNSITQKDLLELMETITRSNTQPSKEKPMYVFIDGCTVRGDGESLKAVPGWDNNHPESAYQDIDRNEFLKGKVIFL